MERNKIICGDNVDVMKTFPDNCIDLTCTSPPYDNLRSYNGYSFDFEAVAQQLYRVTKEGGVVVWVVGDATINGSETGTSFKQALYFMECGFNLHDTMIWKSDKPPLTHNRYEQTFEYMFVLCKGKLSVFNPFKEGCKHGSRPNKTYLTNRGSGKENSSMRLRNEKSVINNEKIKGNIWEFNTGYQKSAKGKIPFQHPAIFPERLANDHIISWSNKGDLVLDPFTGSGTTCKMARENGRDFIGIEISQEYCAIAEQRISQAQLSLF